MDVPSETRPLLHSFENESWRSKTRKKCMRIPSEITITGIILGLFLVVVTLLIVFQNMDGEKNDDATPNAKMLASPFKFNKKAEDKLWQDKKNNVKNKVNDQEQKWITNKEHKWDKVKKGWKTLPDTHILGSPFKYNKKAEDNVWQDRKDNMKNKVNDKKEKWIRNKEQKWDKINKGWKKFPDVSGKINEPEDELFEKNWKDSEEIRNIPEVVDEYGKEIDDSFETFLDLQMSDPTTMQEFNKDTTQIKNLLHSKIKWKDVDDGWQKLSEQGWTENDIRQALFKAIKDKRAELMDEENPLQSPMNFDQIWDNIIEHWNQNLKKGSKEVEHSTYQGNNENIDAEIHEDISDEWINEMNILQSPKSSFKKFVKSDDGWNKLLDQGWKNKDIEEALVEAWNERENNTVLLKSPMNFPNLWGKTLDFFRSIFHKGMSEEKSQKEINDEWANKFSLLQSPMSAYKKWKKNEDLRKKHSKDDWKDKAMDEINNENDQLSQSSINFDDIMEEIINSIKDHKKGTDEQKSQKEINDEWANKFNLLQSQMSSYKKWKKIEELKKKHSKDDEDKTTTKPGNEEDQPLQSPINFEGFMEKIIERIKEHKEDNKKEEKQKDINDEWKNAIEVLQSSKPTDQKWKEADNHWKTLLEHGGKDIDIKEGLYNAWKDGNKLKHSATGYNNMKWKKVNEGWKKISNKSIAMPTRCPISKIHRELLLGSAMPALPIDCALITEEVRRKFGRCIDLSFLPKECKPSWREKCFSTYKYRKIDGTCNNKIHPTWGQSGTPFVRMLAPDYDDGVSALRTARDGGPLPNPRLLSRKLYSKQMKPDSDTSVLFMYFGLFVDHDMVETAVDSDSIPCCNEDFLVKPENRPKECLQIDIPSDDPFYGPKDVKCLNLVRSIPVNGVCGGRREQLNKATSFLDGSVVYGSVINQAKQLRTFNRGQLKTQLINNTPFMPNAEGAGYMCGTPNEPLKCFEAGDSRVNMMVELTAMHTLWHREHNRIATKLHKLNPQWRDEILYQEARRILIGEFQHITYNEFLPILLGKNAIEDYEIKIADHNIYDAYDETVDPSVFNVFGAAAFRFGHSIVPDMQYLLGANNSTVSKVSLHETFFNAKLLYHKGLDLLLRGAAKQRTQSVDSYISPEVREHLFQPADLDYGYDLAAVGIQRGRDHGLPSYRKWRSVCGLSDVKTWDDLYNIMDKERADMFRDVYKSIDDIDLIPGALAERHEKDSLVGPTYTCLIGRQFKKTRKGDRFWFEIQNEIGSFTRGQLDQIYKSNMARIICDNSDDIKAIQKHPFKVPSDHNPLLDCDGIQKVDLSEWRSNISF